MKPFPPPELIWQPDETRLHVDACPDLSADHQLSQLIGTVRGVALTAGLALYGIGGVVRAAAVLA